MSNKGGKATNSGGFGCIFKPPLKCTNSAPPDNYISKLMTKQDAIEEFDNIKQFEQMLNKIPNYGDYFLVKNVSLCTPAKLTKKDLKDFDKICMNLDPKEYTKDNINEKLSTLGIINIPDAGVDLKQFLSQEDFSPKNFIYVNHLLIDLLQNAIVPMNALGIYHNDVKPTNIMVDKQTNSIKLIDYGISSIYEKGVIPRTLMNKSIHFNFPYSTIMFNNRFISMFNDLVNRNPEILDGSREQERKLKTIIIGYYFDYLQNVFVGHHYLIVQEFFILNFMNWSKQLDHFQEGMKEKIIVYYEFLSVFSQYLYDILIKFTKSKSGSYSFNVEEYYDTVYRHNCDVWGLLMSYIAIISTIKMDVIDQYRDLIDAVNNMIYKFLYNTPTDKIDIKSLVATLQELNSKLPTNITGRSGVTRTNSKSRRTSNTKRITLKSSSIPSSNKRTITISKLPTSRRKTRCKKGTKFNKSIGECVPHSDFPTLTNTTDMTDDQIKSILGF